MANTAHTNGDAGGYLVGRRHSEGGIKAVIKPTGQPIEMEGGEVVITRKAVKSKERYEFEGVEMTPRQILSKINSDAGGVSFADGGEVPPKVKCRGQRYSFRGKDLDDQEISSMFSDGGELDPELANSEDIEVLLAPLQHLNVDNKTRCQMIAEVLDQSDVPFDVMRGEISCDNYCNPHHYWVEIADGRIVDFDSNCCGSQAAKGVFRAEAVPQKYRGGITELEPLPPHTFKKGGETPGGNSDIKKDIGSKGWKEYVFIFDRLIERKNWIGDFFTATYMSDFLTDKQRIQIGRLIFETNPDKEAGKVSLTIKQKSLVNDTESVRIVTDFYDDFCLANILAYAWWHNRYVTDLYLPWKNDCVFDTSFNYRMQELVYGPMWFNFVLEINISVTGKASPSEYFNHQIKNYDGTSEQVQKKIILEAIKEISEVKSLEFDKVVNTMLKTFCSRIAPKYLDGLGLPSAYEKYHIYVPFWKNDKNEYDWFSPHNVNHFVSTEIWNWCSSTWAKNIEDDVANEFVTEAERKSFVMDLTQNEKSGLYDESKVDGMMVSLVSSISPYSVTEEKLIGDKPYRVTAWEKTELIIERDFIPTPAAALGVFCRYALEYAIFSQQRVESRPVTMGLFRLLCWKMAPESKGENPKQKPNSQEPPPQENNTEPIDFNQLESKIRLEDKDVQAIAIEMLEGEITRLATLQELTSPTDEPVRYAQILADKSKLFKEIEAVKLSNLTPVEVSEAFLNSIGVRRNTIDELLKQTPPVILGVAETNLLPEIVTSIPKKERVTTDHGLTGAELMQIETPNFIKWFGDWREAKATGNYNGVSKVVDAVTGAPMPVYHGTSGDFMTFSTKKFPLIYLAENFWYAYWFASYHGEKANIFKCFVDIKDPIDLTEFGIREITLKDLVTYLDLRYGIDMSSVFSSQTLNDFSKAQESGGLQKYQVWVYLRNLQFGVTDFLVKKTLYDGIIMYESNPADNVENIAEVNSTKAFVVFNPEQIKLTSSLYFSESIPDVRFEQGGVITHHQ